MTLQVVNVILFLSPFAVVWLLVSLSGRRVREANLRAHIDHLERMVSIRDGELKELKRLVAVTRAVYTEIDAKNNKEIEQLRQDALELLRHLDYAIAVVREEARLRELRDGNDGGLGNVASGWRKVVDRLVPVLLQPRSDSKEHF